MELVASIQRTQFNRSNFPSLYNRNQSAELWGDSIYKDSISGHYSKLRETTHRALSASDLDFHLSGMFLWIDTPWCLASDLLKFVSGDCGYLGSDGRRYGWPTGSRWTLVDEVNYDEIANSISRYSLTMAFPQISRQI